MTDIYEVENQLDPVNHMDENLDKDGDGLSKLEEFQLSISASTTDTNSDWISGNTEDMNEYNQ
jgi:hypothetical protein